LAAAFKTSGWVLGEFFAIDDLSISAKIGSVEIGKDSPNKALFYAMLAI
jgi:hypothetical protein